MVSSEGALADRTPTHAPSKPTHGIGGDIDIDEVLAAAEVARPTTALLAQRLKKEHNVNVELLVSAVLGDVVAVDACLRNLADIR